MKPILLKMQAFGSFVKEEIDFSVLPDDLYLIAGDTGSGKTTIFDAIMFALYGTASGTARSPRMLHSDYALGADYQDTRVELTFSQNDRKYRVARKLHYKKSLQAGETDEAPQQDAEFEDAEGTESLQDSTKVTRRIVELTGIGAEQFRKIAMLAQGEFRAFLSDSKGRSEILSRLFDDTLYRRFENVLDGARKKLQALREDQLRSISVAVDPHNLNLPEEMTEDQRAAFSKDNVCLTEALDGLIAAEQADEERLEGALRENEVLRGRLTLRLQDAARINRAIDTLEAARARKAELEARRQEMDSLRLRADAAERALHVVGPADRACREAAREQESARLRLNAAKAETKACAERAEAASAAAQEAEQRTPDAQKLRAEEAAVARDLPKYAEQASARDALASGLEAQKRAAENAEQAQAALSETRAKLEKTAAALPEYEGAETEAIRASTKQEKAEARFENFSGEQGLSAARDLVLSAVSECERLDRDWKKTVSAEIEKKDIYDRAYRSFRLGQAGLMADLMRRKISEKGVVKCPVCYAVHRLEDAHEFAPLPDSTPTEAEVDAAKKDYDAARDISSRAQTKCEKAKTSLELRREKLVTFARTLGLTEDAETLLAPGFIEEKTAEASLAALQAKAAAEAAAKRAAEKKGLEKEEKALRTAEQSQQEKLQSWQREGSRASEQVRAAQGKLEGMGSLPYESEEAAKQARSRLSMNASAIERAVRDAVSLAKDAGEAFSAAQAAEAAAGAELERRGESFRQAEAGYRRALEKAGMDEADYSAALPEGEKLSAWKESLQRYAQDTAAAGGEMSAAEAAVREHPDRVDTQQDDAALQAAQAEREQLEAKKKREAARLAGHKNVLSIVRGAKEKLAESDAAFRRLDRLARLACNSDASARDAKTSFHRYIQNFVFREIVEEANSHLSRMTAGKYLLQDRDKARNGHSNSGLLLDVLDTTTGKRRDTDSLSGGESFQTSLALALGLSGVVQRHSGVCRVDSMFIDEGFGTLSETELESAVCTLRDIARGGRQIGIISHVKSLEESIDSRIVVRRGPQGSKAEVQV